MYIYCLFCETGRGPAVAREAERRLGCRAISPLQVQHTWSGGRMTDRLRDLLPGYVFLYADSRLDRASLGREDGVLRWLTDTNRNVELCGEDERFALMLLRLNGVVGRTKVRREGELFRLCDPAYDGVRAEIRRVDRRNGRMQLAIPFENKTVETWVEYEVIE